MKTLLKQTCDDICTRAFSVACDEHEGLFTRWVAERVGVAADWLVVRCLR